MIRTLREDAAGFTVLELMVVVTLIGITTAMAVFQAQASLPSIRADGGMRVIIAQLNTARAQAISERRNIEVDFPSTSSIRLQRHEIPNGTTVLSVVPLESRVQFLQFRGVPDTPDALGANGPLDFGEATAMMFTSDGMFIDQSGLPLNGTIFLGIPDQPRSARAVTIFGATGRIRGYRWNGVQWSER
jgi:prepilin-type N-terminal cleavage/methylation domain-containing protein